MGFWPRIRDTLPTGSSSAARRSPAFSCSGLHQSSTRAIHTACPFSLSSPALTTQIINEGRKLKDSQRSPGMACWAQRAPVSQKLHQRADGVGPMHHTSTGGRRWAALSSERAQACSGHARPSHLTTAPTLTTTAIRDPLYVRGLFSDPDDPDSPAELLVVGLPLSRLHHV